MSTFTGSIKASIGADTGDYKQAMSDIINSTQSAMSNVTSTMSTSTNSIVSKVGQIMSMLASSIPSKLSSIGTSMVAPFNKAGGAIQRTIASIAEKIPDPFRRAISTTTKVVSDGVSLMGAGFNKLVTTTANIGTQIGSNLTNGFNSAGQRAAQALNSIGDDTNKTASITDGLVKKVLGLAAAYAGISTFKNLAQKAIGRVDTIDTATKSLTVLTGSGETATKVMEGLAKGIEGTPIALNDVALGAKKMVAAGMEGSKVETVFQAIADAAYGVGDGTASIDQMTSAISSLQSSGIAYSDDINRLVDAGVPAWQILANSTGKSVGDMKEAVSKGSLESKEAIDILVKGIEEGTDGAAGHTARMAGLAKTAGDTISGSFANMKTSFVSTAAKGLTPFKNVFIEVMTAVTNKVKTFRDAVLGTEETQQKLTSIASALSNVFQHVTSGAELSGDSINSLKGIINGILPIASVLGGALVLDNALPSLRAFNSGILKFGSNYKEQASQIAKETANISARVKEETMKNGSEAGKLLEQTLNANKTKFTGFSAVVDKSKTSIKGFENGVSSLVGKIPKVGTSLEAASSVGMGALNGMTSTMGTIMQVALASVGPAAILGLVVAGLGIVNSQFGTQIDSLLQMVTTKGPMIITNLVAGITSQIPQLITSGTELISKLANTIATMLPLIVQAGVDVIGSLVGGIGQNLPSLISSALTIITTVLTSLASALPQLLMMGMELLLSLVNGIVSNIPQIVSSVQTILTSFVGAVVNNLPQIIQTGIQILLNLINGLTQMLPQILPVALNAILMLINGIMQNIPMLLNGAVQIITALCNFIVQNLPMILQAAIQILQALIQGIVTNLPNIISAGIQIIFTLVTSIIQMLPDILAAGWEIIKSLATGILEAIPNILKGAWDGIKNGFSNLWDTITGKSKETSDKVSTDSQTMTTNSSNNMTALATNTSTSFGSMANTATTATSSMNTSVSGNFGSMTSQSSTQLSSLQNTANGTFQSISNDGSSSMANLSSNVQSATGNAASAGATNFSQLSTDVNNSMNKVSSTSVDSLNKVKDQTNSIMNQMKSSVSSGMNGISSSFQSGFSAVVSAANNCMSAIQSSFSGLPSMMTSIGFNAGLGLANGLANSASSIYSTANAIATNVAKTMQSALDIHSPSRVTRWMGEMLGKGLGLGMQETFGFVNKQAQGFGDIIKDQSYEARALMVGDTTFTNKTSAALDRELDNEVSNSNSSQINLILEQNWNGEEVYTYVKSQDARNENRINFIQQ